jgi:hypothetical protein
VVWLRFELGSAGDIVTPNNLPSYCKVVFVTSSIAIGIIVIMTGYRSHSMMRIRCFCVISRYAVPFPIN